MEDSVESLERLAERIQQGSQPAFGELVRRTHDRVRAYLGRYVRSKDIVDDLAQETFLKAYRRIATYRHEGRVMEWLLAIARTEALLYIRSERGRLLNRPGPLRPAVLEWLAGRLEGGAARASLHDDEIAALKGCIESLPDHSAQLVSRHYFNQQSLVEIARATGKRTNALGVTLFRIREALRECIQRRLANAGVKS